MNRRESLKALALGTVSAGVFLEACKSDNKNKPGKGVLAADNSFSEWENNSGRQPFEKKRLEELTSEKFFTEPEMKTIAILADIIIPADDRSGSATDAGVPDFIEFIVKDMPHHQTPMRGG